MTNVTGGQTVRNPWPMIGGCASSTCREGEDFIRPIYGKEGDVIEIDTLSELQELDPVYRF